MHESIVILWVKILLFLFKRYLDDPAKINTLQQDP